MYPSNFLYVLSILTAPTMSLPPPEASTYVKERQWSRLSILVNITHCYRSRPSYLLGDSGTLMFDVLIICQTIFHRPKAALHARFTYQCWLA